MEHDNLEESIRRAEGNLKHSGMYITDGERELIRLKAKGKIDQEEFIKRLLEYHTRNEESDTRYSDIEERIITPKS